MATRRHDRRCRDGPLLFRGGLCDRSAPSTPSGSLVLHLQGLHTVRGLRQSNQGSAPACPCQSRVILCDAAGFLIVRTDHSLAVQDDFVVALRRSDLSFRRPPATGLLGHYPDRTLTGKSTTTSGHTLLQNPRPGLLPSPRKPRLGPLDPLRECVSTRQSSLALRPAASRPLASTAGFRLPPEVGYRGPLVASPGRDLHPPDQSALRWAHVNGTPTERVPARAGGRVMSFLNCEDWIRNTLRMGPARELYQAALPKQQEAARATVLQAMASYLSADGLQTPGAAWIVTARA